MMTTLRQADRSRSLPRVEIAWMYLGFTATGVALVLPGALLPALLASWHLSDSRAGVLFLASSVGCALGALLTFGELRRLLTLGTLLVALAAAVWPWAARMPAVPAFIWGLGLGAMMTSISLLRQRARAGAAEMVRLNFLWAMGACACPSLMAHALGVSRPQGVLHAVAACFAVYAAGCVVLLLRPRPGEGQTIPARGFHIGLGGAPLALVIATALAPGIESAGGAWLAAYAARSQHLLLITVAAPTCLWAGLLGSRVLGWLPGAERLLERSTALLLVLVATSACGLLLPFTSAGLLLCAFGLGFGLGPLYPALLARVLAYDQGGAIFFLAGVASSILPWVTGLVSQHTASLRAGMIVPAASGLALMIIGLRLPQHDDVPPAAASS